MPTFVLFFQDKGFTLAETLLLQSIFSIAIVVLEIPSGYFSDYFGRKKTLVIGSILGTIGYLCYAYSFEFWHFVVAETLLGLGASFISGTDSALLYDSLKELNKTGLYKKYEGFMQSISSFSEGFAAIAGGFIALISLSTPFLVQAGLLFVSVLVALSIKNPSTQTRKDQHDNPLKDLVKIVKYTLHEHKEIRSLIMYSGIIGGSTLTLVFLIQPFLQKIDTPLALFGILWAAFNFSIGIFALTTHRIEEYFGKTKSVALLILLVAIGYFGLGYFNSYYAIALIFIFYFIRAVSGTIISGLLISGLFALAQSRAVFTASITLSVPPPVRFPQASFPPFSKSASIDITSVSSLSRLGKELGSRPFSVR
jgi:MFS family permease